MDAKEVAISIAFMFVLWIGASYGYKAFSYFSKQAAPAAMTSATKTAAATVPASREYMIPDADIISPRHDAPVANIVSFEQSDKRFVLLTDLLPRGKMLIIIGIVVFIVLLALYRLLRHRANRSGSRTIRGTPENDGNGIEDGNSAPAPISEVQEEPVEAADDADYSMFIGGAAADLLDIEGGSSPIDSSAQVCDLSPISEVHEEPVEAADDASLSEPINAAAAESVDASPDGTTAGAPTTNACARPLTMQLSLPSDSHGASAATLMDDAVPVLPVFAPFARTMPTDAAKAVFRKALGVAGPMDGRKLSMVRDSRQPSPSRPLPLDNGIFYSGEQRDSKGNRTGDSRSEGTGTSETRVGDDVGGIEAEIVSMSHAIDGASSYEPSISSSGSIIGAASDSDCGTTVSGFYGNAHGYDHSYSTFDLDISSAGDALSLDYSDRDDELDFVLVGDVEVLPALSRVGSHLVKHPKAFIRLLIPVLQGCQDWRARSICGKSFEMELWTLERCCKLTRGSEQIEKRSWLSFKSSEFASLDDALNQYTAQKVLGKLNLSTCGECGKVNLGGQTRVRALAALPPILTIQLVGYGGIFRMGKSTSHMSFTAELDMRSYIRHSHDHTQKTIYSLFLVVARDERGGGKGNYISFARSSSNDWYRCRAGHHPDEVREDVVLAANARVLVYTLVQ